ncbi:hypothetical protein BKA81DRAFT_354685 [Phyllosticta paracitricarpa]
MELVCIILFHLCRGIPFRMERGLFLRGHGMALKWMGVLRSKLGIWVPEDTIDISSYEVGILLSCCVRVSCVCFKNVINCLLLLLEEFIDLVFVLLNYSPHQVDSSTS